MNAHPMRQTALLGLAMLVSPLHSLAADDDPRPVQLAPVFITATRLPLPARDVLSDVVSIDAQAIRDSGAGSLVELLQSRGGAEIAVNGGPGQTSSVFLRGSNANHVVVLIDGVRVNSATAGSNAFEQIPLNQIDRIEIRRGPSSSLYGADAVGGVIQIYTTRGAHTSARLAAGSWRSREAALSVGREFGATRVSANLGHQSSGGYSATNAQNVYSFNPDRDPYRNVNFGGSLSHDWAAGQTLTAQLLRSEGTTDFDSGADADGNYRDDLNRQRLSTVSLDSRNRLTTDWLSSLRLARGTDDSVVTGLYPGRFRTDQDQATWQNDLNALGGQVATGLEWRRESVSSDTLYAQTRRDIRAVFASYAADWQAQLLQISVRHDDNTQFGGHTTGNLAYGWRVTPLWRLSASAGTAFKAPSYNDLYYVSDFFSGNPELRPERSRSAEMAVRYTHAGLQAGLTAFQSRITDLIASDPTFTTVVNVNQARIRGTTLNTAYAGSGWSGRAEWTHQNAVDDATGLQLVRRARDHGSASVETTTGPWRGGAEWVLSGARYDSAANSPASRMGGYGLLNLRAGRVLTPELTLSLKLNNAADKAYELAQGYNTAGRHWLLALEYRAR